MSKVKEQNYVVIQGWMLSKLQLKGNDLLIYAIIYGFSQNTDCKFTGSLQYLADWTNSTKQGCLNSLKNLLDKKLITKKDYIINGVKFVEYYSNDFNEVVKKVEQGYSNDFNGGSQETLPNNTNDKLIDNSININDKANTASGFSNKKENPTISILENVQPTVKENLTVQSVDIKEHELKTQDEIRCFVEKYDNKTFDDLETDLITEYILKRKEAYKSKVKNTKQALTGLLNNIVETRKQFSLEWIFEMENGCYKRTATSGDATKPFQTIKPEYYKKLNQSTFNNQYAKPKMSTTSQVIEMLKVQSQYIKNNKQTNNEQDEYPF